MSPMTPTTPNRPQLSLMPPPPSSDPLPLVLKKANPHEPTRRAIQMKSEWPTPPATPVKLKPTIVTSSAGSHPSLKASPARRRNSATTSSKSSVSPSPSKGLLLSRFRQIKAAGNRAASSTCTLAHNDVRASIFQGSSAEEPLEVDITLPLSLTASIRSLREGGNGSGRRDFPGFGEFRRGTSTSSEASRVFNRTASSVASARHVFALPRQKVIRDAGDSRQVAKGLKEPLVARIGIPRAILDALVDLTTVIDEVHAMQLKGAKSADDILGIFMESLAGKIGSVARTTLISNLLAEDVSDGTLTEGKGHEFVGLILKALRQSVQAYRKGFRFHDNPINAKRVTLEGDWFTFFRRSTRSDANDLRRLGMCQEEAAQALISLEVVWAAKSRQQLDDLRVAIPCFKRDQLHRFKDAARRLVRASLEEAWV